MAKSGKSSSKSPKPRKTAGPERTAQEPAPVPAVSTAAVMAIALALVTIAIYAQVRSYQFISLDDPGYVPQNTHVATGLTAENVAWAFTSGYAANWHPLTWMSHQLDVSLFGVNPGAHHLINVGWHVLGTLLLFGLLQAMTGALWRSAFVAGVFAVHPAHVESVAWIAERKDVLSACFWFATTWMYVVWTRRPSAWRYAATVALFALGLMAKPMLVTLPFTLLLLDIWPLGRASLPWSRRIVEKLPLFVMSAASSVVTAIVQRGAVSSLEMISPADRLANAVLAYGRYVKMLVWPSHLAILYPLVRQADDPVFLVGLAVVVLTVLAWLARRSMPFVLVGWLWFLGTLVPVIGLVQVGVQSMADRYTYIPSVGIFIAIAWGAQALAARARIPPMALRVVGAGIIAALALTAETQIATWATSETLWRQAITAVPDNVRAYIELGTIHGRAGRPAEAAAEFQRAINLPMTIAEGKDLFPDLSQSLLDQGKTAEAIPYLERSRQLSPERADICHHLALAYLSVGRKDDAIATWREAVRLNPNYEDAYFTMGVVLAANGRADEARRALAEVLRINPSRKDAEQALAMLKR